MKTNLLYDKGYSIPIAIDEVKCSMKLIQICEVLNNGNSDHVQGSYAHVCALLTLRRRGAVS